VIPAVDVTGTVPVVTAVAGGDPRNPRRFPGRQTGPRIRDPPKSLAHETLACVTEVAIALRNEPPCSLAVGRIAAQEASRDPASSFQGQIRSRCRAVVAGNLPRHHRRQDRALTATRRRLGIKLVRSPQPRFSAPSPTLSYPQAPRSTAAFVWFVYGCGV
jgi:hypothetical protein